MESGGSPRGFVFPFKHILMATRGTLPPHAAGRRWLSPFLVTSQECVITRPTSPWLHFTSPAPRIPCTPPRLQVYDTHTEGGWTIGGRSWQPASTDRPTGAGLKNPSLPHTPPPPFPACNTVAALQGFKCHGGLFCWLRDVSQKKKRRREKPRCGQHHQRNQNVSDRRLNDGKMERGINTNNEEHQDNRADNYIFVLFFFFPPFLPACVSVSLRLRFPVPFVSPCWTQHVIFLSLCKFYPLGGARLVVMASVSSGIQVSSCTDATQPAICLCTLVAPSIWSSCNSSVLYRLMETLPLDGHKKIKLKGRRGVSSSLSLIVPSFFCLFSFILNDFFFFLIFFSHSIFLSIFLHFFSILSFVNLFHYDTLSFTLLFISFILSLSLCPPSLSLFEFFSVLLLLQKNKTNSLLLNNERSSPSLIVRNYIWYWKNFSLLKVL